MANRRAIAIVLVALGTALLIGLLAAAIYGEIGRPAREDKANIAKLLLISAWDGKPAEEEAVLLQKTYDSFLRLDLDKELYYTTGGKNKLDRLEDQLNLTLNEDNVRQLFPSHLLKDDQGMFDKLYELLSPEDTILDPTVDPTTDTIIKQLSFVTVSLQEMKLIMRKFEEEPQVTPNLLAIEAWPPAKVKILRSDPGQSTLVYWKDLASLEIVRQILCSASTPNDSHCIFERE